MSGLTDLFANDIFIKIIGNGKAGGEKRGNKRLTVVIRIREGLV